MRFDGKVVAVTGVGHPGQVGETVARAFGEAGARVAVVSRSHDDVEARARELRSAGVDARAFACDLADPARVAALPDELRAAYGERLDALVNLAGGFASSGTVADSDPAVWQKLLTINLTTAYLATRALLPLVRTARGAIVYFASVAALPGARIARTAGYAIAKTGVVQLMRAVAEEERAAGVRANALAPGSIRTAANIEAMGEEVRYIEREDVANAVLFLCSDDARAITGQVVALT